MTGASPWALELEGVSKLYEVSSGGMFSRRSSFTALAPMTLRVPRGHAVGIVGESGSGKSTLGSIALTSVEPTTGSVILTGQRTDDLKGDELRAARRRVQAVFQDPGAALNPRRSVMQSMLEPLQAVGVTGDEARRVASDLLASVGIDAQRAGSRPGRFSGGQRQRITIARALAAEPEIVVADEPVSALDVSVQAQILNLFRDMQQRRDLSTLFVSHDLGVVSYIADTVIVLYRGEIVEAGPADLVIGNPAHPYTCALKKAAVGSDDVMSDTRAPLVEQCEIVAEGLTRLADGRLVRPDATAQS